MTGAQARLQSQLILCLAATRPQVPEAGRQLWRWFLALSETRSVGFGPSPISHAEIEAYARLNRLPLQPWHVEVLRAMDVALMERWRQDTPDKAPDGTKKLPPVSRQEMTPQLFDAMF